MVDGVESSPALGGSSHSHFRDPVVVFRGTYPETLARALTEGYLRPS